MADFKNRVEGIIGKTSDFLKEQASKVSDYVGYRKDLYEVKLALDSNQAQLDKLFIELGQAHYGYIDTRNEDEIIRDIRVLEEFVDDLTDAYNELLEEKDNVDDDSKCTCDIPEKVFCYECGSEHTTDKKFCSKCGTKLDT